MVEHYRPATHVFELFPRGTSYRETSLAETKIELCVDENKGEIYKLEGLA